MARLFKNDEFRRTAAALAALFAVAAASLLLLCALQLDALHGRLVAQASALVGKAVAADPALERAVVSAVLAPVSPEDEARGRGLLAKYGYDTDAPVSVDPFLSGAAPGVYGASFAFTLALAAAALIVVARGFGKAYGKVRAIASVAEKVVDGDTAFVLPCEGEGDFEILGHRFNQMANRLRRSLDRLAADKAFLRDTISDISHQLKTPLAALSLCNDLMLEDASMDEEHRRNFLDMGRRQLERIEWLIQGLLKMARLEAGSVVFASGKAGLKPVADAAAAALAPLAEERGVSVEVLERQAGTLFTGDPEWLAEALINVLKNAIEHSRPGGAVRIAIDQTPLTSSVIVTDRGEGIGRDDLPHVFERFYRGSAAVKPDSVGIGLAMAKAIVEGQGGSITVKSEMGKGSEFSIVFLKTLGDSK